MAESEKKEKGENGEWFYNDEYRNQKGPVTPEKMGEFYKEGIVQNLTLCWKTGMSEWVQLRKIEELKPFIETFDDDIKDLEKLTNSTIGEKQDIRKKRKRKKKKKWKALKDHSYIYIKGLPKDIKEKDFIEYFSKCGIIRRDPLTDETKTKLYKDKDGNPKGDGLVSYLKEESVPLAIEMLDGSFISPEHQIRVEKAEFKMKGDVFIPGKRKTARENASKRMTKRKIAMAQSQSRELCWDDAEEEELAGRAKLRIVILKPMFVLKEVQKSENLESFYDDLGKEVGLECEREAGSIEKLTVFEGSGEGAIAVKFKLATSAARCISVMNGRFFAGRKIECSYFDGTDYRVDKEETEQEREQRIAEFGKWLTKE